MLHKYSAYLRITEVSDMGKNLQVSDIGRTRHVEKDRNRVMYRAGRQLGPLPEIA